MNILHTFATGRQSTNIEVKVCAFVGRALRAAIEACTSRNSAWRSDITDDESFVAVVLVSDAKADLLDFVPITRPFRPFRGVPYHEWLLRQPSHDFWTVASSYSVYWQAVWLEQFTSMGLENWPYLVDHRLTSDPLLSFLDCSHGYIQWDWQVALLYFLCVPDRDAADQFRKDWNGMKPAIWERAAGLRLPDGRSLVDVLKERARPGGWQAVRGVPVYSATRIMSALAMSLH